MPTFKGNHRKADQQATWRCRALPTQRFPDADAFLDTNVLLYTIDEDPASASKRQRAQQLILSERWGWSVQVAAEFFVNATSPKRPFRRTNHLPH